MKVLIIQQKMIGDVLTSSILFEALREKYPNAQLDYLINSHTYPVVENNPFIDNYIFFTNIEEKSKIKLIQFARNVGRKNYDVVIDVYSKISSNIIALFSKAPSKISYYKPYTTFLYNHNIKRLWATDKNCGLAIVNRMQLLKPLDVDFKSIKPKVYLTDKELEESERFLKNHGISLSQPIYMIGVLGSGTNKTYPFEYMAQIIDTIANTTQGQILFNYIPNQIEDAKAIYKLCKPNSQEFIYFDVFGKSLREFLAITAHCKAIIGNEGGAINMAKALNTKTFTIFSPWIDKATWNLFEAQGQNESVHLKDFKPKLYKNKTEKELKPQYQSLYASFVPNLFENKLIAFLKRTM